MSPQTVSYSLPESIRERWTSRARGVLLFMLIPIPAPRHDLPFPTEG
jgi:hypothetical protein